MDMAIAIRTAIIKGGRLYAQAGAGVVYDSNPDSEWQETINKASALIAAAALLNQVPSPEKRDNPSRSTP